MDEQKLKDILIDKKAIVADYDDDPFVGIYFQDLVEVIKSVI